MKKQIKSLALAATVLAFLSSCGNFLLPEMTELKVSKVRVNFGENARTITSNTELSNLTDITLVASATGKTDKTVFENKAYAEINNEEFIVEAGTYNFTLTARDSEKKYEGKLLNKEIGDGVTPLSFELEFKGIDWTNISGQGGFKVSISAPNDSDKVGKVKASLYDRETGTVVPGYEAIELTLVNGKYTYEKSDVEIGNYRIVFDFYGTDGKTLIGQYREIVTVSKDKVSQADREIEHLNTMYSIDYNLAGGNVPSTAPENFSKNSSVTLPEPTKNGFIFDGWYTNSDFTGDPVTSVSSQNANITLYAKFLMEVTIASEQNWQEDTELGVYAKLGSSLSEKWGTLELFGINATNSKKADFTSDKAINSTPFYVFGPKAAVTETTSLSSVTVNFENQKQKNNNTSTHLKDYQYLYGSSNSLTTGKVTVNQIGSQGKFTVTIPSSYANKTFTQMILFIPTVEFTTKATINLSTGVVTPTSKDIHFKLQLENVKASNGKVILNAMLPSFDATGTVGGVSNKMILTLVDADNEYYVCKFAGVKVENGKTYSFDCGSITHLPHWVQLLPGLKVATHNVGAYSQEDCGSYFGTSEISGALATDKTFKTGCTLMTADQIEALAELSSSTTTTWVRGVTVTSADNKSVYFAANGYRTDILRSFNAEGNYWAAKSNGQAELADSAHGVSLYADCDGICLSTWPKDEKFNLRPVIVTGNN